MNTDICYLPKFLQPKDIDYLIRVGKDNDGGYLVDRRNILNSDLLISFGINDDWSFEEDFYKFNNIPIYAFDGTISLKVFIRKCMKSILKINKPKVFFHWFATIYNYKKFFRENKFHYEELVGIDSPPNYKSLSSILSSVQKKSFHRVFFKIDIEGMEYRLLNELILFSKIIEGIVIEFHDVDLHLEKIEKFIEKFPLNLVHTHCNNFSLINKENIPLVIECSFSREKTSDSLANKFPNLLDMPNDSGNKEYILRFL